MKNKTLKKVLTKRNFLILLACSVLQHLTPHPHLISINITENTKMFVYILKLCVVYVLENDPKSLGV